MVIDADADHHVPWMAPTDAGEALILNPSAASKLHHPRGFQAAMADGQVRYLSSETKSDVLRALISIAGSDAGVVQAAN